MFGKYLGILPAEGLYAKSTVLNISLSSPRSPTLWDSVLFGILNSHFRLYFEPCSQNISPAGRQPQPCAIPPWLSWQRSRCVRGSQHPTHQKDVWGFLWGCCLAVSPCLSTGVMAQAAGWSNGLFEVQKLPEISTPTGDSQHSLFQGISYLISNEN